MFKLKSKDRSTISGGYACLDVKLTFENIEDALKDVYGIC